MKGHGATQCWAEVLEPPIVASKHLRAADLCRFGRHRLQFRTGSISAWILSVLFKSEGAFANAKMDTFSSNILMENCEIFRGLIKFG